MKKSVLNLVLVGGLAVASNLAFADSDRSKREEAASSNCAALPNHAALKAALIGARNQDNGGFNLDMWATIVDRDGIVCAVAFTGADRGSQWPGSRVISAQKANTANAFSLPGLALSTANLYTATQPGGSLFGLQFSNPVDTEAAYKGPSKNFGKNNDPLVGEKIGGVNVFGGGLALYNSAGTLLGAIGVSGDSSCADHNIAWRTRATLGLNHIPGGVGPGSTDGIDYDQSSGWAHPICNNVVVGITETIGAGAGVAPAP